MARRDARADEPGDTVLLATPAHLNVNKISREVRAARLSRAAPAAKVSGQGGAAPPLTRLASPRR